jgi:rhodanese-related sulfurtransferase/DNA-binding transcriptional ArsR family regulator
VRGREAKQALYEQFARIGKAVASPKRIELLDLLCQGERTVENLAKGTRMGVTNTSAHLQVLRRARLVETRREGVKIFYRVADEGVCRFYSGLRDLGRARLAEVEQVVRDYFEARDELEPLSSQALLDRLDRGEAAVIDVRPAEEFAAGHIPGAMSIPLPDLEQRLGELPGDVEIVAYCRGPYCVLAPEALTVLRANGFRARRLEVGFPEWRLAGMPAEIG